MGLPSTKNEKTLVTPLGSMIPKNVPDGPGLNTEAAPAGRGVPSDQAHHSCTDETPPVICTFASQHLLPILDAFLGETEGVRSMTDIEHLHRMRVASRRMRAGLNTFRRCFDDRRHRKVFSGMRNITRALGEARDGDVQIAFLKKLRKRTSSLLQEQRGGRREEEILHLLEAISYLLGRLRKERARCQKHVIAGFEEFEKQHIQDLIREAASRYTPRGRKRRSAHWGWSTLTLLAIEHIGRCLADLHAYGPWVQYTDAIAEHHAMRIAAKRLRYTMEIFSPLYRLGLKKHIARVAELQRILGDLHDTDVWIDSVTLLVLKEHSSPRRVNDPHRPGPSVIAGLKVFQRDREKDRRRIYRRMVQYWDHLQRTGSWEDLKGSALSSHKVEYATRIGLTETERREAVLRHVTLYPEGEAHSRHVARLSLQLFDQLRELHQLTEHDRILLEYGCLLHDIGWSRGKKGHARESAAMIHAAGDLPFSLDERGDVGFLACSHRGKDHTGESGYFAILSAERQSALRILAGIIRVADGLDGTHRGRVESVSCEPAADSVTCRVFASQDCAREIRMAKEKADLFEQVFGKHFMPVQERPHPGAGAPLFPAERD